MEYEPEEDGNAPLEFYEEELKELEAIPEEEKWKLFQMAAAGDRLAKGRLTQGYLQTVYDLSRTYQYEGVPQGDLIQEGNIGLMLALEDLEVGLSLEEYEKGLFEKIQKPWKRQWRKIRTWQTWDRRLQIEPTISRKL